MLSFIISNLLVVPSLITGSVCSGTADYYYQEAKNLEVQSFTVKSSISQEASRDEISTAIQVSSNTYYAIPNVTGGIVDTALSLVGVPYVYAGSTPAGFDCSGFTMYVYAQHGIALPHSGSAQAAMGSVISEADAQPGDLLIWPGHVGIWLSPGVMIDSAVPGTTVQIRSIWGSPQIIRL